MNDPILTYAYTLRCCFVHAMLSSWKETNGIHSFYFFSAISLQNFTCSLFLHLTYHPVVPATLVHLLIALISCRDSRREKKESSYAFCVLRNRAGSPS